MYLLARCSVFVERNADTLSGRLAVGALAGGITSLVGRASFRGRLGPHSWQRQESCFLVRSVPTVAVRTTNVDKTCDHRGVYGYRVAVAGLLEDRSLAITLEDVGRL